MAPSPPCVKEAPHPSPLHTSHFLFPPHLPPVPVPVPVPVHVPVPVPVHVPVPDPANLSVLTPDCLFFLAFYLFVTVIKHVRGHPSGPKISRSHPDCLLVTSSGRNIRLLTCTFILLARTGRYAAFMSAKRRRVPATPDSALQDCPRTMLQGALSTAF